MSPKTCPTCDKRGLCYDSRPKGRWIERSYKCPRDGTRWMTREIFYKVKEPRA